ncbi:MAG: M20/M25/M40 family metallo-hydrolase [Pyrinomonadaceae bacterium]
MKSRLYTIRRGALSLLILFTLLNVQAFAQTGGTAPAKTAQLSAVEKKLTGNISVASIKSFTNALSADEMEGRGTMQPGGDKAAKWIADRFKALGLKPLGDQGSYLQAIKFKETVLTSKTSFQIGDETFKSGEDYGFVPLPFKKENSSLEGDLIFFGYGTQVFSSKAGVNPFAEVKGKIVVLAEGPPESISQEDWEGTGAAFKILQGLMISGAKSVIIIGNGRDSDSTATQIDYFGRRQIALADESDSFMPFSVPPIVMVNQNAAQKLFAKSGKNRQEALTEAENKEFKPFALGQTANITTEFKTTLGTSSNVIGYIEGSDPKLKAEAVIFSAHYDAYGLDNGKIYNGAADNALGTAEMLSVAEAFSKMSPKPKRSLVFLAVTGEEYGLYGSKYWARNPTWDILKVAADLNLDGIGTEVYGPVKIMVGYGAEHSTLGAMFEDAAAAYGVRVIPDPVPSEKVFYRSDHYSFVERGVPALMLMGAPGIDPESLIKRIRAWEKANYHQPTDDVMADWDWSGAKTVADVMGVMGLRAANAPAMPQWLKTSRFADLKRGNTGELPEEQ